MQDWPGQRTGASPSSRIVCRSHVAPLCTAISPGGDIDTTAVMAGAISGAHLGLEAIPIELAHQVTDQEGYAELVELAERCYEVKMQPGHVT